MCVCVNVCAENRTLTPFYKYFTMRIRWKGHDLSLGGLYTAHRKNTKWTHVCRVNHLLEHSVTFPLKEWKVVSVQPLVCQQRLQRAPISIFGMQHPCYRWGHMLSLANPGTWKMKSSLPSACSLFFKIKAISPSRLESLLLFFFQYSHKLLLLFLKFIYWFLFTWKVRRWKTGWINT